MERASHPPPLVAQVFNLCTRTGITELQSKKYADETWGRTWVCALRGDTQVPPLKIGH